MSNFVHFIAFYIIYSLNLFENLMMFSSVFNSLKKTLLKMNFWKCGFPLNQTCCDDVSSFSAGSQDASSGGHDSKH